MSGEKDQKQQVHVDPRCIQEALRIYFQPIKNDDPRLDFYTMYKRETMEFDTECMNKYNEDLNTTLIFAGLFSAVSSAFVIAIQPELQQDPSERLEAYLQAILRNLNPSVSPGENLSTETWVGPPQGIVTTSDFLYASLLMSLLAAFVAMLGKQWLNRYLRHAGGSMIERCGDRQRKFDGLEKWPFRLFVESLPIILQIALFLLSCGLSRYMWSVNTSVACVIISFTLLGFLFYIGIVVAGTSSYECPFQTPASMALRYVWNSGIRGKILTDPFPSTTTPIFDAIRGYVRRLPLHLSRPNDSSLAYTAWVDTRESFVLASHRLCGIVRQPFPREVSLSRTALAVCAKVGKIGRRVIGLFLRAGRALKDAGGRLVRDFRRFGRAAVLPIIAEGTTRRLPMLQDGLGLRLRVRNLETVQRQNADNARCVCWVLQNITDPEAIDSAIRLAGTIRWFDGSSNCQPPFDSIVSTFKACFDSSKQVYPGMRDRAYFSARAILQIHARARARSSEYALKYPIPTMSSAPLQHTDPDLHHVISLLKRNSGSHRPTIDFPKAGTHTHAHLLWTSDWVLDIARVGPNPSLDSYESYLSAAITNNRVVIANVLLMWWMFLGGHVEEETFWATNKSDSLDVILSHLSTRIMNVLTDGHCVQQLRFLFHFLVTWEERPVCLTPMAYQWCSTLLEADRHWPSGISDLGQRLLWGPSVRSSFSEVGPACDLVRSGDDFHGAYAHLQIPTCTDDLSLLLHALMIGFRQVGPGHDHPNLRLGHTTHHDRMFEIVFSGDFDEVTADAASVWIVDGRGTSPGSFVRYFSKRVEGDMPLSPRLRRVAVYAFECNWRRELRTSRLETVRLLNHLKVDVDDIVDEREWAWLLVAVILSPTGLESLSKHYWWLLDKLGSAWQPDEGFASRGTEVMKLLEEAEDWEKLEVWMAFMWRCLVKTWSMSLSSTLMENVEGVTLRLLAQRPSALPRFESLGQGSGFWFSKQGTLQDVCHQARAERTLLSESPVTYPLVYARPTNPVPFEGDDTF